MINHELPNQGLNNFRGFLVYQQECTYKMITLTVSLKPGEQSHVITHAFNLPCSEGAEHLQECDLYSFAVSDGERIQLLIETPAGNQQAWYTVHPDHIAAESSSFSLSIGEASPILSVKYAYTQDALDEALDHYADQIPHWLGESFDQKPLHEVGDFGR